MPTSTARCLDLTRLISRMGKGPFTGVDRVELAYLRHFVADDAPLYILVRTRFGFLLLDHVGARAIRDRIEGTRAWGKSDLLGRLRRRAHPMLRRAEADLRRLSIARAHLHGLQKMVSQFLPEGTAYFSVGHSNLSKKTLSALSELCSISVLVHDMIPLDHPEFQRKVVLSRFRAAPIAHLCSLCFEGQGAFPAEC